MSHHTQITYELIKNYYAAFNANNIESMLKLVAQDVAHDVNQGERRLGKAAFADFCAHMDKCYAEQLKDMVIMVSDDGKRASAEFVVHGIYKAADEGLPAAKGQTYTLPAGTFFEIRDGLICRITTYYNLQDWLKQVA